MCILKKILRSANCNGGLCGLKVDKNLGQKIGKKSGKTVPSNKSLKFITSAYRNCGLFLLTVDRVHKNVPKIEKKNRYNCTKICKSLATLWRSQHSSNHIRIFQSFCEISNQNFWKLLLHKHKFNITLLCLFGGFFIIWTTVHKRLDGLNSTQVLMFVPLQSVSKSKLKLS